MEPLNLEFRTKNDKQIEACEYWVDDSVEEIVYGGSKGGGKSFLGASLIFADALTYAGTAYFIARKELNDLRKFTQPTIREVFENWGLKQDDYAKFNGQDNFYTLYNGSLVYLIACKEEPSDPLFERFGSMQMTRGWIEEAGEVAEAAKANLWLSVGRWKNDLYGLKKKLLMTCNPKKNWLKRDYVDRWKKGILEATKKFVPARSTDNPYLPEDYVETLRNEKDTIRRQRLFEGNWDYDDDNDSYFPYDTVTDMFTNVLLEKNGRYMTVDVSRKGVDRTVIGCWQGLELYKVKQYQGQGIDTTAICVKETAVEEQIPFKRIIIDEDGVGGGVVDLCRGVHGFINNATPMPIENPAYEYLEKPNFANLKTQCAYMMSVLSGNHEVAISIKGDMKFQEEITAELQTYKEVDPDDDQKKIRLIAKDDQKLILGKSPDLGDMFIMRGFFLLKKEYRAITVKQEHAIKQQEIMDNLDFDQFAVGSQ